MSPLEKLLTLEIEFHHRLRRDTHGTADTALHTSYAIQSGYEQLLRAVGPITAADIHLLADRMALAGDSRDVMAGRDSLTRLLGLA